MRRVVEFSKLVLFFVLLERYGRTFRLHLGLRPNLVVSSASAYEVILGSTQHTSKGRITLLKWSNMKLFLS